MEHSKITAWHTSIEAETYILLTGVISATSVANATVSLVLSIVLTILFHLRLAPLRKGFFNVGKS